MNISFQIMTCESTDAAKISEVAIKAYKDFYLYLWYDNGDWYINRSFATSVIARELNNPNVA